MSDVGEGRLNELDQEDGLPEYVWTFQGYHLDRGNFTTAMVHYYRAEVTRANLWRNRLDTTTNWAVVTTAAALTFSFGSAQNPHFVLLLVLLLVLIFLGIEARRYIYYSLWYHRVRLMETDFFARMVSPPFQPSPDWADALNDSLQNPAFAVSFYSALGSRYRRNYFWLVTLILLSWLLKLVIHPIQVTSWGELVAHAAIGAAVPGGWVLGVVGVIYAALGVTALVTRQWLSLKPVFRAIKAGQDPRLTILRRPRLAIIITCYKDKVAAQLLTVLKRGVTALEGVGMYTGAPRSVLLCAVTDVQVARLEEIVRQADPQAFVVVADAERVRGGGFAPLDPPS